MNADGSDQKILLPGFNGGAPAWSPDGSKILFIGNRVCRGDIEYVIYVMNADGSNTRLLTDDPNSCGMYGAPRWSPDGTKIIASFRPPAGKGVTSAPQIVVMNADGSNPINISNRSHQYLNTGPPPFTGDVQADWQPLPAPSNFASSVIGFSTPSYTVNNDAGSIAITVTRTGNLNDVASCSYVISDEGFKIADGTLRFAPGESSKTISIVIQQWHRSFKIVLCNNEGNATFVGGIQEAVVTILRKAAQ